MYTRMYTMMEWAWPLGIILASSILVLTATINRNQRKLRPPGPPGWPIIGNILDIDAAAHRTLDTLCQKYGPLVWLRLGALNTLVISSAEVAMEMFKNHDVSFAGRTTNEATRSYAYDQGSMALGQYGPYWRMLRRICTTEIFSTNRVNSTENLRKKCIDHMLKWMWDESQEKGTLEIARFVSIMSFNMASNVALSKDLVNPQSKEDAKLFELISRSIELGGEPNLSDFFPILRWLDLQGIKKKMKHSMGPVHEYCYNFVRERIVERENGRENTKRDLLNVMLDFQGNEKDGEPAKISQKNIGIMILEFFAASTDTTTSTIEWVMTELLCNPQKMEKVQAELDQIVGANRKVVENDIANLHYLQAVVKETLRLHPPIPLLIPRRAMEETKFMGYVIPKNTQILVNAFAIGRDPNSWNDPLSFMPERFLGSNIDYKGGHYHFIPFGSGRRICAGMPIANRSLHLALGSMLHCFEWDLACGMKVEDIDMKERLGVTLRKAVPLKVVMKNRGIKV